MATQNENPGSAKKQANMQFPFSFAIFEGSPWHVNCFSGELLSLGSKEGIE
jgi:hypothetical protein